MLQAENQEYGFDECLPDIPQFFGQYGHGKINDETYRVPWKSAESDGIPDRVKMEITAGNLDSIRTRLTIETGTGTGLTYGIGEDGETWELTLTGQAHESIDRITAYYTQDNGTRVEVGYLDLASYQMQRMKLNIVPVKMDYDGSEQDIMIYLNKVYGQATTSWYVTILAPLETEFEDNDTPGLDTELPDLAAYTREMRNINNAMKDRPDYDPDAYYLFIIDKSEDGDKKGIMPFARHFGFIFMDGAAGERSRTIAHELGHGAFCLKHPWTEKGTSEGQTYSIMDYRLQAPNTQLYKYQWDEVHNPRSSLFGGDEEDVSAVESDPENPRYMIRVYSPFLCNRIIKAFDIQNPQIKALRIRQLIYEAMTVPLYINFKKDIIDEAPPEFIKWYGDIDNLDAATFGTNYNPASCGVRFDLVEGDISIQNGQEFMDYSTLKKKTLYYGTKTRYPNDYYIKTIDYVDDFDGKTCYKNFLPVNLASLYSQVTDKASAVKFSLGEGIGLGYGASGSLEIGFGMDKYNNYALITSAAYFISGFKAMAGSNDPESGNNMFIGVNVSQGPGVILSGYDHVSQFSGQAQSLNLDVPFTPLSLSYSKSEDGSNAFSIGGSWGGWGRLSLDVPTTWVSAFADRDIYKVKKVIKTFRERLKQLDNNKQNYHYDFKEIEDESTITYYLLLLHDDNPNNFRLYEKEIVKTTRDIEPIQIEAYELIKFNKDKTNIYYRSTNNTTKKE